HDVYVRPGGALGSARVPIEHDASVARPGRKTVTGRVVGQTGLVAAIGVHRVDLVVAVAVAHEDDRIAIGRPGGFPVGGGVVRNVDLAAAVGVHGVDLDVVV